MQAAPAIPKDESPAGQHLLLNVFRHPEECLRFDPAQWNYLLRAASETKLLARLAHLLDTGRVLHIPPPAADVLRWAKGYTSTQERAIRWEVRQILAALRDYDGPIVLLKGAAYIMASLSPARGRTLNDVDIMVPRQSLSRVEAAFLGSGWEHGKLDGYDQSYYRRWMHELPPLQHRERETTLDVHHTILPETGRLHPRAEELFSAARPIPGTRLQVLHPADMILHSAAHLFQDGAVAGSLRDLFDIHDLLDSFRREPEFSEVLRRRALLHQLTRPLFYALRYCSIYLGTQVPPTLDGAPPPWVIKLMDTAVSRALLPAPPGVRARGAVSRTFLFVRSHWLRMPAHLLVPHLLRKSLRRWSPDAPRT
jgi:hypothetical protein